MAKSWGSLSKQEQAAVAGGLLVALRMAEHVANGDFDKKGDGAKSGKGGKK